jgi:SlyX protein
MDENEGMNLKQDTADTSGAATTSKVEQRLMDLEIKASFAEDLLDELNQVVVRQQQQIDLLTRELVSLRQQPAEGAGGVGLAARLSEDMPPHY